MALYDANELRILDVAVPYAPTSHFGVGRRVSWPAITVIAGLHLLAVATIDITGALPGRRASSELKLIQLSPEMAPPPTASLPEPVLAPQQPQLAESVAAQIVAPPPIVLVAAAAPIVALAAPAPVAPTPVESGPVRMADLDSKATTIIAPKYPIESRRKREQGTVVLAVTLGRDGSVAAVAVERTSGFGRLDKAALDAVRRWRWSPTMRGGEPVPVTGTVDIPFVLQG